MISISGNFRSRGDWRSVDHLYQQFSTIVSKGERIPIEIAGALGNYLGRVLAFYEDTEQIFVGDLLDLWCEKDRIDGPLREKFRRLYFDSRLDAYSEYAYPQEGDARRRPRPFEAAVETCRRLIDLNRFRRALADMQTGAVLGGSTSYGRFYNVTGAAGEFGSKPSDTDLLLVLRDYRELEAVADRLSSVRGIEKISLDLLRRRITAFSNIRSKHSPCILSHKLNLWASETDEILSEAQIPGNYNLSLHVFSLEDFDYMTLKDIPILESDRFDRPIRDYRDSTPPEGRAYDSRSFAGIPLGSNPLRPSQVDLGVVANVKVCLIEGDRYCPGLHQNLVLPQFEKRWETEEVRLYLRMLTFRWKILERLRLERTKRPFEIQSLSLSHVRSFVFSPHITRRADRG